VKTSWLLAFSLSGAIASGAQTVEKSRDQALTPCSPAKIFKQVPGMPLDQLQGTISNLHHDLLRWKKTLSQIAERKQSEELLLDRQIQGLMTDVNASLSDLDESTTVVVRCPKFAEIVAMTFDLSRLHENLLSISGLTVLAHNSSSAIATATASSALRIQSERWQQIVKDVATEVQPYRDGLESYTFHLLETVDVQLSK
jgi:hypothetical protein